ncbi:glutamyl-tRNA reductase [Streptomyces zagrosensis]|uniref:Glutamyl-tRNA reductase n=1 Tax=Streptomyces zagrosensis TaxID=1042984 RepID=A0A7W9QDY2_9ACTN|nr:glutamyl-tRNA reductase [Streptomyces zagrosensis]MBB5937963.1 glutamyl-tRNA reductase [Streptomyces zagrosensis]
MSLLVIGLSHRSAPVSVLERAALPGERRAKLVQDALAAEPAAEAAVLATCNRVELYADVDKFHAGIAEMSTLLALHTGVALDELTPYLYVHYEDRAVHHLFSVACGLDSMVVGEGQILGQIKDALALGQELHTAGRLLNDLFQQALRVGKRAHSETGIDKAGQSLVTFGLEQLAGGVPVERWAAGKRALVIGAGSMSSLAATTLARAGVAELAVANRTLDRAHRLATALTEQTANPADPADPVGPVYDVGRMPAARQGSDVSQRSDAGQSNDAAQSSDAGQRSDAAQNHGAAQADSAAQAGAVGQAGEAGQDGPCGHSDVFGPAAAGANASGAAASTAAAAANASAVIGLAAVPAMPYHECVAGVPSLDGTSCGTEASGHAGHAAGYASGHGHAERPAHTGRVAADVADAAWHGGRTGLIARAVPIAEATAELAGADIVVSCTGATGLVLDADALYKAAAQRPDQPLALLDLAMPRDIDAAAHRLEGVRLVDIESLAEASADAPMAADVDQVRAIVSAEVAAFGAAQRAAHITPTVVALRTMAADVVAGEIARLDGRLPDLDEKQRAEITQTVRRVVDKLLHAPTVRVKQLASTPGGAGYADALRELFDLDPEAVAAVSRADGNDLKRGRA